MVFGVPCCTGARHDAPACPLCVAAHSGLQFCCQLRHEDRGARGSVQGSVGTTGPGGRGHPSGLRFTEGAVRQRPVRQAAVRPARQWHAEAWEWAGARLWCLGVSQGAAPATERLPHGRVCAHVPMGTHIQEGTGLFRARALVCLEVSCRAKAGCDHAPALLASPREARRDRGTDGEAPSVFVGCPRSLTSWGRCRVLWVGPESRPPGPPPSLLPPPHL